MDVSSIYSVFQPGHVYPGEPVKTMWRKEPQPGDIFPPPAMGRHGMVKNRLLNEAQGEQGAGLENRLECANIH